MKRFFDKVRKTDTCWNWTGATRSGYGAIKIDGKVLGTHRVSYEMHHGIIPPGKLVCHTCDNPRCVNPEHLFLGTYSDNIIDALNKDRRINPIGWKFQQGVLSPRSTLLREEVSLVKQALDNRGDRTITDIATQFNIPRHVVRDISAGRSYL
jgi:hypothetical protein